MTKKRAMQGVSLVEACVAFSLTLVSVMGCLTTCQMAIQWRHRVEARAWALTHMEALADTIRRVTVKELDTVLRDAQKSLGQRLKNSRLSWQLLGPKPLCHITVVWTVDDIQQISFTAMPRDFHSFLW